MARPVYTQVFSADGQTVEGAMSIYHDRKELPDGQWSVTHSDGREELMRVEDMPQHWQEQLARVAAFGESL